MTVRLSADDLRNLADALDALTEASRRTGVTVDSYGSAHITVKDHVMRMHWEKEPEETASLASASEARYVVEIPDER